MKRYFFAAMSVTLGCLVIPVANAEKLIYAGSNCTTAKGGVNTWNKNGRAINNTSTSAALDVYCPVSLDYSTQGYKTFNGTFTMRDSKNTSEVKCNRHIAYGNIWYNSVVQTGNSYVGITELSFPTVTAGYDTLIYACTIGASASSTSFSSVERYTVDIQ